MMIVGILSAIFSQLYKFWGHFHHTRQFECTSLHFVTFHLHLKYYLHQVANYSDRVSPFSLHSLLRETTSVKHISETNFFQWNGSAKPLKNHGRKKKSTGNGSALFLFTKTSPNEFCPVFWHRVCGVAFSNCQSVRHCHRSPMQATKKKRWTKKG